MGGYLLRQIFGLGKPYPTSPHDLKLVLCFKSYSIFSTKLVLKARGVNLEKIKEKRLLEVIFIFNFICHHKSENGLRKNLKNRHENYTKPLTPQGTPWAFVPYLSKSRCHQNLSNTVHRIKIVLIKFGN